MNYNGNEYFYITNLQGDIIELVDLNGNTVVKYKYDAWGNLLDIDGSLASTIGVYNPYRHRGYRYDEEISMYYLNSRFYDANIGRFLNADGLIGVQGNIIGHNIYSYGLNNSILYIDESGYIAFFVITAIVGAAIGAFAVSTITSFIVGASGYAINEYMNDRTPTFRNAMGHGGIVAVESMITFGMAGIVGSVGTLGNFNFISKEWFVKQTFIQEFTFPSKHSLDKLRYMIFD